MRYQPLRQGEGKWRALADFALQPNLSSMQFNKFLSQCQPQPSAFLLVSIIAAHLAKLLKDRRLFGWRNTNTGVTDGDLRAVVCLIGADADAPSLGCELHCVGKKVEKNLFDLALIADVFGQSVV